MIRIALPYHLRNLARVTGEIELELGSPATIAAALDALESQYPALRGTIRDQATGQRRPMIRYFACRRDLSCAPVEEPLPGEVLSGAEPLRIVGAMAGG